MACMLIDAVPNSATNSHYEAQDARMKAMESGNQDCCLPPTSQRKVLEVADDKTSAVCEQVISII